MKTNWYDRELLANEIVEGMSLTEVRNFIVSYLMDKYYTDNRAFCRDLELQSKETHVKVEFTFEPKSD